MDRRFIEQSFPVKEVGAESAREKNIHHGHISTLHIWWSRKPLASSRATTYAALIPEAKDEAQRQSIRNFIIEFSRWENSLNTQMIQKARSDILKANDGVAPKVLDPFAGGGSIPLEALRLGCEVYSNDYNPVAILLQKCTLEYPQRYGNPQNFDAEMLKNHSLLKDVKTWGEWVLNEAKKEIGKFYPNEPDGSVPVSYIWANTIPCQNPACNAEIPLMLQFWLINENKKKVSLYPYIENGKVCFKIVGDGYEPMPDDFDPDAGTVSKAIATCLVCGATVDDDTTKRLFQEGKSGQRMVAVVLHHPDVPGKKYRLATEQDVQIFFEAENYLEEKRKKLMDEWGFDPVPDEPMSPKDMSSKYFTVPRYGVLKWGDLFNSRQKLALITFVEKVREVYRLLTSSNTGGTSMDASASPHNSINGSQQLEIPLGHRQGKSMKESSVMSNGSKLPEGYAKAVVSYLALNVDRLADYNSILCRWHTSGNNIGHTFGRQAFLMVWDYSEANPFSDSTGSWNGSFGYLLLALEQCMKIESPAIPKVSQFSATTIPYPDNYFDAVITDPPYYDNINYADLSDFFYVWLKRAIGDLYPELFVTPLVPKSEEIVANPTRHGNTQLARKFFEENLAKSFKEVYRVLKPGGVAIIVYAHKSTAGWETLINSLLDSGLVVTSAWPINTEMQNRLNALGTASLASSIYIVARKIERQMTCFYNDVKQELTQHLEERLNALWNEGISGADFFISAIGSAIEVFGKYQKVIDFEGNVVRADKVLNDVRELSTSCAVRQILHSSFSGGISDMTRFYVLYRWTYGESKVIFDDARKLATGCGIDLSERWNRPGVIKREKEYIRVLGPHERKLEEIGDTEELIDVLHKSLLLWEKGRHQDMLELLNKTGFGYKEIFYRIAQAISETLPTNSKEKKLLDGFLVGKERLIKELMSVKEQSQHLAR